jgi:hypothetical protein
MMESRPLAARVQVSFKDTIKELTVVVIMTMCFTCDVHTRVTVLDAGNVCRQLQEETIFSAITVEYGCMINRYFLVDLGNWNRESTVRFDG